VLRVTAAKVIKLRLVFRQRFRQPYFRVFTKGSSQIPGNFPKNGWIILLGSVQEQVYMGVQMKVILLMSLLSFQSSRSGYF